MIVGRVSALWRYPVKSMQGEPLRLARLGANGIPGDRGWSLGSAKQTAALMACSARYVAASEDDSSAEISLPDGSTVRCGAPDAESRLASYLGRDVSLRFSAAGHFDDQPLHLLASSSLRELARRRPGADFDARRFRPNIVIETLDGRPFPEPSWVGRRFKIGAAELSVGKPTRRCVMITHAQPGLAQDPQNLKDLGASASLGVYASVLRPGTASISDDVELLR